MNFFEDYSWHSSLEIGDGIKGKKIIRKITASKANLSKFIRLANDSNYLIHASTKELWKISDDGTTIAAVFPEDILTMEQL